MHDGLITEFKARLAELVALMPTASNVAGRVQVRAYVVNWLERLRFEIREVGDDFGGRIVIAERAGPGLRLGLCAHYDVEEAGDGWDTPPFEVTQLGRRLVGRGVADNLGPLVLRLLVLERLGAPTLPLVFIIQGEEEVDSPSAHALFPMLAGLDVDLWVEETGYFELDGTQRLLVRDLTPLCESLVAAIELDAVTAGRLVVRHDRYLNKAFGQARCPFLTHLVAGGPYLAIGPNDPGSRIHQSRESLNIDNLDLSARQFATLVSAGGKVEPCG